jgi:8-oxo-dGTP pyrophosphatase MutT (NUDIX family)
MQFNFVVSTNTAAVRLWQSLGFVVVGTLPGAFRHRDLGDVDALVMYRSLDDPNVGETTDIPLFGERVPDAPVVVRPSAYLVVADDGGRIALVSTGEGVFLPGGGVDSGESAADSARRETREECALDVRVEEEVGRARDMVWSRKESTCVEKRCVFFSGTLVARTNQTAEHEVRWLNPNDALEQISRSGHAWALRKWTERGRTGL